MYPVCGVNMLQQNVRSALYHTQGDNGAVSFSVTLSVACCGHFVTVVDSVAICVTVNRISMLSSDQKW